MCRSNPIQVDQVQLDPKSAFVFSRAQNVNKLISKMVSDPVVSKRVNPIVAQTLKLDVSWHAVTHTHIVPLHGLQQRKGLNPDNSVKRIKHVRGVCCVNQCLSVPPVPNGPNVV